MGRRRRRAQGDGRGRDGRFLKGNPGGPGNPQLRRLGEYQRAVREAISPELLAMVLGRMVQKSVKDGDAAAARVVAERCLGKVTVDPLGEGFDVRLPRIRTFDDVLLAVDAVLQGVVQGKLPLEAIEKVTGLLEATRRIHEEAVIGPKLDAIEDKLGQRRGDTP